LNERVQSYFAGLVPFARPPRIIANGVDQALFRPLAETARRRQREALSIPDAAIAVLFVGRFVEKKGLHALRELAARHPDLRWYFIGSGPRDPRGWALGNVTTVGRLPQAEIIPWYQAADLLVLPSRGEGFPLVVQESMACGTPVLVSDEIASSVPGLGAVAYSAAPDTESLTNALAGILAEPDRLRQRRAEVEAFARRNWDWEQCADAYLELLAGLKGEPWKEPRTKNASSIKRSI
jgi:glycosyltransferase involved in cell wall biosynthesis